MTSIVTFADYYHRIKVYQEVTCGGLPIHWYIHVHIVLILITTACITQIDKGMYISRKLLFAGMLLKVSGLWAKGETVKSGVVTDSTRVRTSFISYY